MRGKARLSFLFGQAAYVFAAVALSGIFVNIVKVLFGRARPRLIDEFGAYYFDPLTLGYLNASFPSGHSTTVGAIVGILMIWYPRWSLLLIELGLFFAATRIAAQAHYPSDVVAGFLVGLFFSIALARWLASRGVVFRFVPGKTLPVGRAGFAKKIAAISDGAESAALPAPRAVAAGFGHRSVRLGPAKPFVLDQQRIMPFDAFREREGSARVRRMRQCPDRDREFDAPFENGQMPGLVLNNRKGFRV